jgi:prepilin-type N-terminal cleavage/methylation domain-containing protein
MTGRRTAGFTLIEVLVAIVILVVGALALVGSGRVATASVQRATLELRVAQLIQEEVERLRTLPLVSLTDGSATYAAGSTQWVVTDSISYLRVELSVQARPEAGVTLGDTVFVYRPR